MDNELPQRNGYEKEYVSAVLAVFRGVAANHLILVMILAVVMVGCRGEGGKSSLSGGRNSNGEGQKEINMPSDVSQVVSLVNMNGVTVDLIEVGPWYNRMPVVRDDTEDEKTVDDGRNRHLVATIVLRNSNEQPVQITLEQAFISFAENQLGEMVKPGELSIMDDKGVPTGSMELTLPASVPKRIIRLRGYGLYGKGHENQTLYLTLSLRIGNQYIKVRRGGQVVVAM